MENLYWIFFFLVLAIPAPLLFLYFKKKEKGEILGSLNMSLFLVMMPKYDFKKEGLMEKEEKLLIGQMEQIFTNFLYLKNSGFLNKIIHGSPKIVLEVASQTGGTDISFYVAVPQSMETAIEKYIQGVYPRAIVEKVSQDYTIFEQAGATAGSYLKLRETAFFPINTFKNLEKDPLAGMTNALSKISPNEGAAIQLVIRPIPQQNFRKRGDKILAKIREGESIQAALSKATRSPIFDFLIETIDMATKKKDMKEEFKEAEKKEQKVDERVIQAIRDKTQKQVFETNIRLITSAQTQERAEEILTHLEGVFGQFSLAAMNSFASVGVKGRKLQKLIYDFSFRNFRAAQTNILNIEELTSIYHFPTHYIETPYIKAAKGVAAAPPAELSTEGVNLIGKTSFQGEEKKVAFASRDDRRRHFYIIGQTGTGKSSLLREMIRQDIQNNEGVAVIDPHGELIEQVLANIPKERIGDVVLFDPSDLAHPAGLNMLEYDAPEQKDFAVQEMIAIFHKLFPPEMIGPMFEHYMRNAMLALMADKENPGTLIEISKMFTDTEFMESRLKKVSDPMVKDFWLKEWKQTTGNTKSDMLGYVVSKIGRFVENEMMRNIIGQKHSAFNLENIMNEKKIFLANLSKGSTGEVNSSLLGLILVSKMQMAAMKRTKIPEEKRVDFHLYIDEFQNFTTDSIATILSEARKYRLELILAHQYMPQLVEEIRNAVLGNVGSIGVFRVGADDAEFLEKQFTPEFSKFDLVNLDNFQFLIKMMINNKTSSPFRVETIRPVEGDPKIAEAIKEVSKLKYTRLKEIVESEIFQRLKSTDNNL